MGSGYMQRHPHLAAPSASLALSGSETPTFLDPHYIPGKAGCDADLAQILPDFAEQRAERNGPRYECGTRSPPHGRIATRSVLLVLNVTAPCWATTRLTCLLFCSLREHVAPPHFPCLLFVLILPAIVPAIGGNKSHIIDGLRDSVSAWPDWRSWH
jgi:hypothetical protein